MKFYKIAIQKFYFDQGYGTSSYFKVLLAVIGFSLKDIKIIVAVGFLYAIFCYLLGRWMYHSGFAAAEKEVINRIDPFVKQMRKKRKV